MDKDESTDMLQLLHMVYLDLCEKNDPYLYAIFRHYIPAPRRSSGSGSWGSGMSFLTLSSAPSRDEAQEMLDFLRRTGDYEAVHKQNPMLARDLLAYLFKGFKGHEQEYLDRFSGKSFTHAYRIKIADCGQPMLKRQHRFTVSLCSKKHQVLVPIALGNRGCELLYLFALLHPSTEIRKEDMHARLDLFNRLAALAYADYEHSEIRRDLKKEKGLDSLLQQSVSRLNQRIREAISTANQQTQLQESPDAYILNNQQVEGSKNRVYFIRLSSSGISLPPSLIELVEGKK